MSRGKLELDCNGDTVEYWELDEEDDEDSDALARDLWQFVIESDPGGSSTVVDAQEPVSVGEGGVLCRDHAVSSTTFDGPNGDTWGCWTVVTTSPGVKFTQCGVRATPPDYWQDLEAQVGSDYTENPWLDFRNGERVLSLHNIDNNEVGVHFLDQPNDPSVNFAALADDTPWSSLAVRSNGQMHLAWLDEDTSGADTIQFSRCAASNDCDSLSDWDAWHTSFPSATQHEVASGAEGALHPQLAVSGGKQFLLGMADPAGNGQNYGVYLYERCGNDAWSGPELVKTRQSITNDQSIANGVPNIVLNKDEHIVHVAFVESECDYDNTCSSEAFWARREYQPCN